MPHRVCVVPNLKPLSIPAKGINGGVLGHYNYRFHPGDGIGYVWVRRVACGCLGCLEALADGVLERAREQQPNGRWSGRYHNEDCARIDMFGDFNDWHYIKIEVRLAVHV